MKRPILARSGDWSADATQGIKKRARILGSTVNDPVGRGLLLGAEVLLEVVHEIVQGCDVFGVCGLLALHGRDDDLVAKGELGKVGCIRALGFGKFEALGEEVVEHLILNGLGMRFFVDDPTGELVGVFGGVLGERNDLLGGLFDRFEIGVHGSNDIVIGVDATGDLAVSRDGCGSEEGEGAKGEDRTFHSGSRLAKGEEGASD